MVFSSIPSARAHRARASAAVRAFSGLKVPSS